MLSVIVPASDRPPTLGRCLAAIEASLPAGAELLVGLEPPCGGPAATRNHAAARARGDVLAFVDADVVVHPGALVRIERRFEHDPGLGAVFGCYDQRPRAPGLVSRYRNLLHHHVHAGAGGPAETFWAGLGAVRREAFERAGGFDAERYPAASVEDIELGMRLRAAGERIELDPAVRGTHLKRWTLPSMLRTDFARRGVPWMRLVLERGGRGTGLNLTPRRRASALATGLAAAALAARRWRPAAACAALGALLEAPLHALLARRGGMRLLAAGLVLHPLHQLTALASAAAAATHPQPPNSRSGWHHHRNRDLGGGGGPPRARGGDVVRLGIVGCGRVVELGYLPALALVDGIELVAVADPDRERRRHVAALAAAAGHPRPEAFGDARELAGSGLADALVVASPPECHLEDAAHAARAGVTVLVEKPPAPDAAGAARLAALEPVPLVGFNRRFWQGRAMREAIPPEGELEVKLEIAYRRASWRPHAVRDSALLDLGPHLVDLALFLTAGEPLAVAARSPQRERAELRLLSDRGEARLRVATDRPHRERVVVRAPGGGELAAWQAGGLAHGLLARIRGGPPPLAASLAAQLAELAAVARGGEPELLATARDGERAMRVVDAATASLERAGEWVAIEPAEALLAA